MVNFVGAQRVAGDARPRGTALCPGLRPVPIGCYG
jgi:hypothetical protein